MAMIPMKHLASLSASYALIMLFTASATAQEGNAPPTRYFSIEFMSVDDTQGDAYMQVEAFWKEIHKARVANGDIQGWDLWSLSPGGSNQGYQYMTMSYYSDPVTMMTGGDFGAAFAQAYSDLPQQEFNEMWSMTGTSRDIAERYYVREIDFIASDSLVVETGMVAFLDFMKAKPGAGSEYVKAELDLFRPRHAMQIEAGGKEFWNLMSVMVPYGSEVEATHFTANIFSGWDQVFSTVDVPDPSANQQTMMQRGMNLRDHRFTYVATLIDFVR